MNTTTAATKANVTTATVRTWCRMGAVAATKAHGRWDIDEASLTHRIALTAKPATPKPLTVDTLIAIGGSRWTKNGYDRVYINNWADFAGLEVSHYNTGNISSAYFQGSRVSNSQAYKLLGCIDKVWFDATDGKLHCRYGYGESREASRETVFEAVAAGIRAAANAL